MLALSRVDRRRRRGDEARRVGQEAPDRRGAARQDARHRRARPHRPGSRQRARARSACTCVAHDPFISEQVAATLGVELLSLDDLCARADYITLHLPATAGDAAPVRRGAARGVQAGCPDRQHGARRADRRGGARRRDRSGARRRRRPRRVRKRAAGRPARSSKLPQVVATPHIAASTVEAQELVGIETAMARPRLPARRRHPQRRQLPVRCRPRSQTRLRPFMTLAERLGALLVADRRPAGRTASASATTAPLVERTARTCSRARSSPACCGRSCRRA